jgi:drug/metabolite transporter (DMT)-like permease
VGLARGALRSAFRRRDWGAVGLLGLLGTTLFLSLLVTGVHRTSPGHAALLVALSPVLAVPLARLLYGEPITARRMTGMALGLLGVALIVVRGYVALARAATSRVVGVSFLVPLIAATIAILAGQEVLTVSFVLGAAAVLAGVGLAHGDWPTGRRR